jgi:hypothetical protein
VKEWTIDKWNTIEIPEIDPHQYNQWLFDNGAKQVNGKKPQQWCRS